MKSHVREQWAKQIVNQSMRRINKDGYDEVEFSPMIKEIINAQAPNLNFTDWKFYQDCHWTTIVEDIDTKEKVEISDIGISQCIDKGKKIFSNKTK